MPNDRHPKPAPGTPSTPRRLYEGAVNQFMHGRWETEAEYYARIRHQAPDFMGSGFHRVEAALKAGLFRVKPPETHPKASEPGKASSAPPQQVPITGTSVVTRTQILAEAALWEGTPYGHGAQGPGLEADCSGSVLAIYKSLGLNISLGPAPDRSNAQAISNSTTLRMVTTPRPGDIVYWNAPYHHTMIYAGNGMVWGASRPGKPFGLRKESDYGTSGKSIISTPNAPTRQRLGTAHESIIGHNSIHCKLRRTRP